MVLKIVCLNFLLMAAIGSYAQAQKDTTEAKVFTMVESPAEFKGGADGWRKYLEKNLNYPDKAVRKKIEGVVRVQFIVDKAGNI